MPLCMLGKFACFFFAELFLQSTFSKISFRMLNRLDPDQAKHFVGPNLNPNYLQRLTAEDS